MTHVKVILPAYIEVDSITHAIHGIPTIVSKIIVVNHKSSDETVATAEKAYVTFLNQTRMGYFLLDIKSIFIILKNRFFNA